MQSDYQPVSLKMTFEGTVVDIGTLTDGNIPTISKNPRTDCAIGINKYAANNQADYFNSATYKELEFRRQDFYFDSKFTFTNKVFDAVQSMVISDALDQRLR